MRLIAQTHSNFQIGATPDMANFKSIFSIVDLHPNILIAVQIFKLTRFARGIFIFPKGFWIVLIYSLLQSSHTSLALRSSDLTDAHKSVFLFLPFWKNLEFLLVMDGGSGADRRS